MDHLIQSLMNFQVFEFSRQKQPVELGIFMSLDMIIFFELFSLFSNIVKIKNSSHLAWYVLNLRHEEDGIAFERRKIENGFSGQKFGWSLPKSLFYPSSPYKLNSSTAEKPLKCKDLPAASELLPWLTLLLCDLICQNNETCRVIKFRQVFLPKGIQSSAGE